MNHYLILFVAITIGFRDTDYLVDENDGQVNIVVEVRGLLQKEVVVSFSTSNLTADGKMCSYSEDFLLWPQLYTT